MKLDKAKIRETEELMAPKEASIRVSAMSSLRRSEITYIDVSSIISYKNQPRKHFDEESIKELAETIKEVGVRQPLTVLRRDYNVLEYEVVSGERRLRASKLAGLRQVPCIILDHLNSADDISIIENIQRQDLHPVELADAIKAILDKNPALSQSALGQRIGLSKSKLSELIKLTVLSSQVKMALLEGEVRGRELLRKLHSVEAEKEKLELIKEVSMEKKSKTDMPKRGKLLSKSLIRFGLKEDRITHQRSNLQQLTMEQRKNLKQLLLEVAGEL